MRAENKTFTKENVQLDSNEFINCIFKDCILTYGGNGRVTLNNCSFFNVKWTFTAAAADTIRFLSALYRGSGQGGRKLVETTFENIKKGYTS